MKTAVRATTAVVLATLTLPVAAAADGYELIATVGRDGKLEGCGVRIERPDGAVASITLHREDTRGDAGPLEVSLTVPGLGTPVTHMTLSTATAGRIERFVMTADSPSAPVHATADVEPDAAAMLMRDVLLEGMTLSIDEAGREQAFRGPALPDVVRGYLQCAGNMGR